MVLTLLLALSAAWWAVLTYGLVRSMFALTRLAQLPREPLSSWPRVSIIIPARNESEHLRSALRAKLADGYPALEVVVVDDRSTDDTGEVAAQLAREDARVQRVRVSELPEGWLGKVHALQRGVERATGEWILFSDADVHLAPDTLTRLIAHAERQGLDHIAALPEIVTRGPLIAPALSTFFRMVIAFGRVWAVSDPRSSAAIGIGAFNLFRRSALDRGPGLAWLRMEIGDDMAFGLLLKATGARQAAVVAGDAVSLAFYPSARAMVRALEKNGAAAPFPVILAGQVFLLLAEWGFLAALAFGTPLQRQLATALWLVGAAVQLAAARWLSLPRWPSLVPFLGVLPLTFAMARSALLAFVRGGVMWRGTLYPTAAVRAGMRLGRKFKP